MKRAYDQLPNEGPKPYAAFRRYCDLGPGRVISQCRTGSDGVQVCERLVYRWSSRYRWHERSAAYDAEEYERIRQEKAEADRRVRESERRKREAMITAGRDLIMRRMAAHNRDFAVAEDAVMKAWQVTDTEKQAKADEKCERITVRMERRIVAMRTLNLESRAEHDDEPTQVVNVGGQPGNPVRLGLLSTEELNGLSFDEQIALVRANIAAIRERPGRFAFGDKPSGDGGDGDGGSPEGPRTSMQAGRDTGRRGGAG